MEGIRRDCRGRCEDAGLAQKSPTSGAMTIWLKVEQGSASQSISRPPSIGFFKLMQIHWWKSGYLRDRMSKIPSYKTGQLWATLISSITEKETATILTSTSHLKRAHMSWGINSDKGKWKERPPRWAISAWQPSSLTLFWFGVPGYKWWPLLICQGLVLAKGWYKKKMPTTH